MKDFGNKIAHKITKSIATWRFVFAFLGGCFVWMFLNIAGIIHADPFPFILLNLILSLIAAIQCSIIMIAQNQQDETLRKADGKRDEMLISILQIQSDISQHITGEESTLVEINKKMDEIL